MEYWLPIIYMSAMGMSLLIYVVLDGYDLGVGLLLPFADEKEKDEMVASIGPFWDANETWIVLGVGILLIAFPVAHGMVLTHLYVPVTLMLMGLILRGVAFDLRVKAGDHRKTLWNRAFAAGSLVASLSQGWMLGAYITGLHHSVLGVLFSVLIALTLPALYLLLGSAWLLIKTEGRLQTKALTWARKAIWPTGVGLGLVSIATPLVSSVIAEKWFSFPNVLMLSPIPAVTGGAFVAIVWTLYRTDATQDRRCWHPYVLTVLICLMASLGLAYGLFPDIVIGRLTIWEAAASVSSLQFALVGVLLTVPMIIGYTIFVYRVFHGKSSELSYD